MRVIALQLQAGRTTISARLRPFAASNAVDNAKFFSRSHDALIRVYDDAGNVIETHEYKGDFKEWSSPIYRFIYRADGDALSGAVVAGSVTVPVVPSC